MKKALIIMNPKAGKMLAKNAMFDILNAFSEEDYLTSVYLTKAAGEATKAAKSGAGKYDLIVCCGGDGTLNEVVSGIVMSQKQVSLGYIPAGSTNDFASSMKIPTDVVRAAKKIAKSKEDVLIDAGSFCEERIFTYIASFGAFTSAAYSVPQNIKNSLGHFAYVLEGIKDLASIKPYLIEATTQGEVYKNEYIFGAVSNSFSVGGIVKLSEDIVSLNDGKFEVLFVKQPQSPAQMNKILWGLINTDFSDTEVFDFFKTDSLTLKMPQGVHWTLDGEYEKGRDLIQIKVLPTAIKLRI